MTPDRIDAVTNTFSKVAPHARDAGLAFYEKLFRHRSVDAGRCLPTMSRDSQRN